VEKGAWARGSGFWGVPQAHLSGKTPGKEMFSSQHSSESVSYDHKMGLLMIGIFSDIIIWWRTKYRYFLSCPIIAQNPKDLPAGEKLLTNEQSHGKLATLKCNLWSKQSTLVARLPREGAQTLPEKLPRKGPLEHTRGQSSKKDNGSGPSEHVLCIINEAQGEACGKFN